MATTQHVTLVKNFLAKLNSVDPNIPYANVNHVDGTAWLGIVGSIINDVIMEKLVLDHAVNKNFCLPPELNVPFSSTEVILGTGVSVTGKRTVPSIILVWIIDGTMQDHFLGALNIKHFFIEVISLSRFILGNNPIGVLLDILDEEGVSLNVGIECRVRQEHDKRILASVLRALLNAKKVEYYPRTVSALLIALARAS